MRKKHFFSKSTNLCTSSSLPLLIATLTLACISCNKENATQPTRTYLMGLQNSAPRYDDFNLIIQSLQMWTTRADAAMITTEVPWDSLYAGHAAQQYVINNYLGLVNYYRDKKLKLWIYIDPQNGLNRTSDANTLVALGKSIAQDEVQKRYRRFVVVMDSILHPDHLGLALETNLIRVAASPSIYNGLKKAVNDAVADVRAIDQHVLLSVSVQADVAWGRLLGNGVFTGIAQDFVDFPFMQELGISSYPYFGFSKPAEIPLEYYSKLNEGKFLPLFITEGGWPSQTFEGPNQMTISGSTTAQQNYILRQSQLLDQAKAIGLFQLVFTDIDISRLPPNVYPTIKYFSNLGLVDIHLQPKPALTTWDGLFKRALIKK